MIFFALTASAATPPTFELHPFLAGETGVISGDDGTHGYATLRRARGLVFAHLPDEGLTAMLQVELAGPAPALLDGRVDVKVSDALTLAVGQQVVTVSRAWNTPLHLVGLGDRGLANNTFTPGRRLGAYARLHEGAVRAELGVFHPGGDDIPPFPMVAMRMELGSPGARPWVEQPARTGDTSGVAVGIGGLVNPGTVDDVRGMGTLDVAAHTHGFSAFGEVFGARDGELTAGGMVQVGQLLPVGWLDVVARGDAVEDALHDVGYRATLGVGAYRHGADCVVRLQGFVGAGSREGEAGAKVYTQVRM
ncbi:MAG: hypothetical protein KC656_00600 [Myxococcales bacterium]|nr:hypothetical protein [Myxococcales bacterium]MCB9693660.1 hypothetical protein [Alphaproteobacteria bacterium]